MVSFIRIHVHSYCYERKKLSSGSLTTLAQSNRNEPPILICYVRCWFTDKVLGTLGEGTFGKVVKVKDLEM